MFRSVFLAAGVFVVLVGASLFQVERVVLRSDGDLANDYYGLISADESGHHQISPPDWHLSAWLRSAA